MAIKEITDHLYQVSGLVNCFVIEDKGELTLVDTGFANSEEKIFKAIAGIGKKPADIKQIILTHLHGDHTGSAANIQKLLGIPVFAHRIDASLIKKGICIREPMVRTPGFINWMVYNLVIKNTAPTIAPIDDITELEEGQILPVLSGIRVILAPGHSAGQVVLLLEKEKVLIAADICSNNMGLDYSIAYEDPALGKKTLQQIAQYDFDIACFGHGNPVMKDANSKMRDRFK